MIIVAEKENHYETQGYGEQWTVNCTVTLSFITMVSYLLA